MFLTLKKEASCETRQHQSYLELKKDVGEESVFLLLYCLLYPPASTCLFAYWK